MRCHALPPATLRKNSLNLPCLYFGAHENLPSSARWKLPIPRTGLREQASSSTPQACAVICWDASWLDIIRADRRVSLLEVWREELLGGGDALEFVAEVLKVFRADFQLQNFVDHRREVRQRTNDSERCCIGRPCRAPRRRRSQRVSDCFERQATLIQMVCKEAIRAARHARSARSRAISVENPLHILAMFH